MKQGKSSRIFSLLFVILLSFSLVLPPFQLTTIAETDSHEVEVKVNFADDNLRNAVAKQLGINPEDITVQEMQKLERLNIDSSDIESLQGLEHAENLKVLFAHNNNISDISPLENLTNLVRLDLSYNPLSNIEPLKKLTNLNSLELHNSLISDISAIEDLTNLTFLDLHYNTISDVNVLTNLVNLEELNLSLNSIQDISNLANLTKLKKLEIAANSISDISVISNFVNLKELNAGANEISNLSPLSNLTNLEILYLSVNEITDISALNGLSHLKVLDLIENNISELPELKGLNSLEILYLDNNNISDISALTNITSLKQLYLQENPVSDISVLNELTNLIHLEVQNTNVKDITVLKELPNLESVFLYFNGITDYETVEYLINKGVEVFIEDWEQEEPNEEDSEEPEEDEENGSDEQTPGQNDGSKTHGKDTNHPNPQKPGQGNNVQPQSSADIEKLREVFPKEKGFKVSDNGNTITIDISDENKETVTITTEQLKALNGKEKIAIIKDGVKLSIPASIFVDSNQPVEITIKKLEDVPGSLSNTYDFTIKQGNKIISEFDKGITLTFNVDTERANNPNNLRVFYYNEETGEWDLVGGKYSKGKVTAVTDHFSTFTVFEIDPDNPEQPIIQDQNKGSQLPKTATNHYNLLLLGLVMLLAGSLGIFIRKKNVSMK